MTDIDFGHIEGYPSGSSFDSRGELSESRVHRQTRAGIAGRQDIGADSIVLSGGYEDDEDNGTEIIYTGHGGRDSSTGLQVSDQVLARGNLALARSMQDGYPVRVIRGAGHPSPHSPDSGYRYDGLFRVDDFWRERGAAGFQIIRFRLIKLKDSYVTEEPAVDEGKSKDPRRSNVTISRVIRDSAISRAIKELYDHSCQVCSLRLEGPAGPYAEGAHIRPLGAPHNGPDTKANVLCLCPNHHALFDISAITIADDYSLIGIEGELFVHPNHVLDSAMLAYRREHYG